MPLPFGLKLKRTRRYTVSSKSCLVARIQLLNNEFVEYTLSVESSGQECLEAVAQRLELREVTYFSLWYFNKQNQQRWVDLEKPLKKQLDKYALEPTVYFGVVYYVPSVSQLQQEITRYQYYLQLKKDILEGKVPCTLEQAVQLAALAVQADFGDYDQYESQDFLQRYALFPVGWIQDEKTLEEATQNVALLHQKLRGLLPSEAEMLYMQEIERLDNYGEESYPAKDSQGADLSIGACLKGVFVKHKNGKPPAVYRWLDITNMTHNKSFFTLELANKEETTQFQTEDMETAKYVWRMCVARHKFYRLHCSLQSQAVNPVRRRSSTRVSLPKHQPYMMPPHQMIYNGHYNEQYASSQDNLPVFMNNQNGYHYYSQTSLDRAPHDYNGRIRNGSVYSAHSTNSLNTQQHYVQPSPMSSNPSITGSDIMRPEYIPSHRHSALIPPSYRPTPDYETVMRQLNRGMMHSDRQSHSMRNLNIGSSYAYSRPDALVYSQPEIREHSQFASPQSNHYPFNLNYSFHSQSPYPYQAERRPVVGAVSVPELTNVQLQAQDYTASNIMKTQVYRPPPPYPYPRPANSTPDLTRHHASNSNPDLITRRVHHSVQMFQEDSLPVAHSLQEVSEPLTAARHAQVQKRNSIEIAGLTHSFEGMRVKERTTSSSAANVAPQRLLSTDLQTNVYIERTKDEQSSEHERGKYGHKKSLSDATMLIHSSEDDEEDNEEEHRRTNVPQAPICYDRSQLRTVMETYPDETDPSYLFASMPTNHLHICEHKPADLEMERRMKAVGPVQFSGDPMTLRRGEGAIPPSVSESDLTAATVRYRVKKEPAKKRPVSEVLSGKKDIVEGLPPSGGMKKGNRAEVRKIGPMRMAAWNGISPIRMPLPGEDREERVQATNDERCKLLEQRLEQGMVFTEYEQIQKKRLPETECSFARLPENTERNRFQDVLPYDDTRVELVPTKENNTGYINASHIKVTVGGVDWDYIASQGPVQNTCQDFWQMVWEQGVSIIAMVTLEEEGGREKSYRYWPRLGSRHNTVTYGRFKITTRFRTDSGCYATTGLKIKHLLTNQERTVWHLQYTDWPEHGHPDDLKGFLSYLEEIQSVRRHTNSTADPGTPNPPVLVHCSAGVGRTGVVILSEVMIACLEHNEMRDIHLVLDKLRQQRMMMVQTIAQYTFVYKVLIQFLKSSRLI
ncbi:tyrosine-protein phosphatase non-receptor type 21 isoform X2 [Spea bombifrons]|uniref:tyrosine-protein phosphatase non-receptor type 21 isoform X2 n=1 Tax=Spea bombifrons TaxID=233779 RepID=UPI002349B7CE|nr:tyrosine-protein phosphatase non-receptor type 21 isoform X2 [Spea bombifrons]